MEQPYRLRVSADLKHLAAIRRFIEQSAIELHTPLPAIEDLTLAVDEAVTNVINHGYRGDAGTIEIEMVRDRDSLLVSLRDEAPVFDPTSVPRPDLTIPLDRRPFGGMGIHLMRESVDEILYRALPQGGNELTLIKKAFGSDSS